MLTPSDIQSRQFSRGVRGYREDEVDTFLDMMTLEFEKIYKENKRLSEDVHFLERELEKYRGAQNEVTKTMEQAQRLMNDISESAEKRADIIVRNAELDAENTMHEARERVQRLEEESKNLHDRYISFRNKYKKMLEDELYRFESVTDELFPDFNENKLEEILAEDIPSSNDSEEKPSDTDNTVVPGVNDNAGTVNFGGNGEMKATMIMQDMELSDEAIPEDEDRKTVILSAKDAGTEQE